MVKITDEILSELAQKGFDALFGRGSLDFLGELKLDIKYVKAYFDPNDGLPVAVLKVGTNKVAQDAQGELHSGALCVLFDHLSTFTAFADPNWWDLPSENLDEAQLVPRVVERIQYELGLSRNIQMHLQRPIKAGETIYFVTKVLENTPATSYFFSQVFSTDGVLLATGHHDKVKLTKHVKAKI